LGLDPLDAGARRDLYEILEERYGRRSTILTSQVPVDKWHEVIGDPSPVKSQTRVSLTRLLECGRGRMCDSVLKVLR
jgi:DNA replication protein DnaC